MTHVWHDGIASALTLHSLHDYTIIRTLISVAIKACSEYGIRCDISTAIELIDLGSADFEGS